MLSPYLHTFAAWLEARRYAPATIDRYEQVLRHFEAFLAEQGVSDVRAIRPVHIDAFARSKERHYHQAFGRPPSPRYLRKFRRGAERVLEFLQDRGLLPRPPAEPPALRPFAQEQDAHGAALERQGRFGSSALKIRRDWVARFCRFLHERGVARLGELSPTLLYDFLMVAAENKAPSTLGQLNAALKDFLRFAFDLGWIDKDFSPYVLRAHTYREQHLPRTLTRHEIQQALARIDIHRPGGLKLKAILTLLASYGLRIGEVAALTLANVDWTHRHFLMPERKNGEALILPLTDEVATALANYLIHERPRHVDSPYLFLTTQRPQPYRDGARLACVVNGQIKRLGLQASTRTFRHAFAKQLVDQAVPLQTIQALLGHRSIESTRIYARIDVEALREVAENDSLDL